MGMEDRWSIFQTTMLFLAFLISDGNGEKYCNGSVEELHSMSFNKSLRMPKTGSGTYPANANCSWRLIADPGRKIHISVMYIDMESSFKCVNDGLEVYDGYSENSTCLGRICGTQYKFYVSSDKYLFLHFWSDSEVQGHGFWLEYWDTSNTIPALNVVTVAGRPTTPSPTSRVDNTGDTARTAAGAAIGGLIILGIIVLCYCCYRRPRSRPQPVLTSSTTGLGAAFFTSTSGSSRELGSDSRDNASAVLTSYNTLEQPGLHLHISPLQDGPPAYDSVLPSESIPQPGSPPPPTPTDAPPSYSEAVIMSNLFPTPKDD